MYCKKVYFFASASGWCKAQLSWLTKKKLQAKLAIILFDLKSLSFAGIRTQLRLLKCVWVPYSTRLSSWLLYSLTGLDSISLLHTNNNTLSCFVESNPVKKETSHTVILPHTMESVWPDGDIIFQYLVHLQHWKLAQICNKFAKVGSAFCQLINMPSKFCQSGEISPNLVTLEYPWAFLPSYLRSNFSRDKMTRLQRLNPRSIRPKNSPKLLPIGWNRCDQIGIIFKDLGYNFVAKVVPKFCDLLSLFETSRFLSKNSANFVLGQFWKNCATFFTRSGPTGRIKMLRFESLKCWNFITFIVLLKNTSKSKHKINTRCNGSR